MQFKGYKLVENIKGVLRNISGLGPYDHYEPGTTYNKPTDCGPFAVFDGLTEAKLFKANALLEAPFFYWEIWECEYEPSEEKTLYVRLENGRYRIRSGWETPLGTVFADSFKLLKKVITD